MPKEESLSSTTFDDVFRTMLERMPKLMIPLINEVFHTDYSMDEEIFQLKNEHVTSEGKVITDSHLYIGSLGIKQNQYHIECQSNPDGRILIRMIEYDFLIALEGYTSHEGIPEIHFPNSCVLYLRHNKKTKDEEMLRIHFSAGQTFLYRIPIVKVQNYTQDEIFQKRLLVFLPYYIMRYENDLKNMEEDNARLETLVQEYQTILHRLKDDLAHEERSSIYAYMLECIKTIADYMLQKTPKLYERIGEVMGGKVLELETDRILEEGKAEGRKEGKIEGKIETLVYLVKNNLISSADAAQALEMPESNFIKDYL